MKTKFILLLMSALLLNIGLAQTTQIAVNLEWVNNLAGRDTIESEPSAVDQNGNIYTAGYSLQGSNRNTVLTKIDSTGNTLWTMSYNGPGNGDDRGTGLCLSDSGYAYICGYSTGSGTGKDFVTIKYSSSGTQLWVARYNGAGNNTDIAVGIAADSVGNVYTVGRSTNVAGNFDYKLVKYNAAGVQQWVYTYNGTAGGDDRAKSVVVADSNRVYITGYTTSTGAGQDLTTVCIQQSTGGLLWMKTINGSANGNEDGNMVIMDGRNPVIAGAIINSGTTQDYYIAKLNHLNGNIIWSNTYNGYGNNDDAYSIVRTDSGYFGMVGLVKNTNYEYHTVIYNNSGTQMAVNKYATNIATPDAPPQIAEDTIANYFYVVGETKNGTANTDVVLYQVSPTGGQGWIFKYNSPGNSTDVGVNVAVNSYAQIFIVALTTSSIGHIDMTTMRVSQTPVYDVPDLDSIPGNPNHIYWQNQGQIINTSVAQASDVLFYADEPYPLEYIKKNAISFVYERVDTMPSTNDTLERIDMTFYESNPYAQFYAHDTTDYYHNYLLGSPALPVTNLYGSHRIFVPNYFSGVDLHYYSDASGLKLYFVVRPGYNPNIIKLAFSGMQSTGINGSGELKITGVLDSLIFNPPVMYNVAWPYALVPVTGSTWSSLGSSTYGFTPGSYTSSLPLVIEISQKSMLGCYFPHAAPDNLEWSTYVGGSQDDELTDVENNAQNTYVMGFNVGNNYPTSAGAVIATSNTTGGQRIVLTRFNQNDVRKWSTYYGNTATNCSTQGVYSTGYDMDVDRFGFPYIVGVTTASSGANMYFPTPSGGQYYKSVNDAAQCNTSFIAKIDTSGGFVKWGTFVSHGSDHPVLRYIDLNDAGTQFVVCGSTDGGAGNGSLMFPTPGANALYDTIGAGLIMRFSSTGVIQYGTRIGGSQMLLKNVKYNSNNEYFITCSDVTNTNPPFKNPGGGAYFDNTLGGTSDIYIGKFNTQDTIVWGTLIGGTGLESIANMDIAYNDEVAIVGRGDNSYPSLIPSGAYPGSAGGSGDITLSKFSSSGVLIYSTTYGGSGDESVTGVIYDQHGYLYLNGSISTSLSGFGVHQLTGFYYGPTGNPLTEGFVIGFTPANARLVSTLFGGEGCFSGFGNVSTTDSPNGLSINASNDLYMAGSTTSNALFPLYNTTGQAYFDTIVVTVITSQIPPDGFVSKFNLTNISIGIEEESISNNSILLFPNPNEGIFNIVMKGDYEKKINLEVYDIAGRLVKTDTFVKSSMVDQKVVNLSELSNGIYFLTLRMGNKTFSNKVIISK